MPNNQRGFTLANLWWITFQPASANLPKQAGVNIAYQQMVYLPNHDIWSVFMLNPSSLLATWMIATPGNVQCELVSHYLHMWWFMRSMVQYFPRFLFPLALWWADLLCKTHVPAWESPSSLQWWCWDDLFCMYLTENPPLARMVMLGWFITHVPAWESSSGSHSDARLICYACTCLRILLRLPWWCWVDLLRMYLPENPPSAPIVMLGWFVMCVPGWESSSGSHSDAELIVNGVPATCLRILPQLPWWCWADLLRMNLPENPPPAPIVMLGWFVTFVPAWESPSSSHSDAGLICYVCTCLRIPLRLP